ncbi:hypothetical protein [Piscibacillus salipiscarius]|uniref:hypothetical protein n=1 Tax=Piscibacillus salipiscarius TaxID=299480 RepID=UPI0006CFD37A|nr:hypothetical protein [Piscibacillus salipiscarius]
MYRTISTLCLVGAVIFILASLPLTVTIFGDSLLIEWSIIYDKTLAYFNGVLSGESFTYTEGKDRTQHFFLQMYQVIL